MSGDVSDEKSDDDDSPKGNSASNPASPARSRLRLPSEIEENLKRVYQASLTEAVPDRFAQLLAQLREKEGKP